jgi:DMSO/TMAO reductase YedYZ heme-binding membrane subunit
MVIIPLIGRLLGVEITLFNEIPFLASVKRDYIHMGTLGFPLLIIIMYIGALDPKISWVKKLLSIRKEISILSGFPVITHSLIRITNTFPHSLQFFTDNEGYMENTRITSVLGAGISNFSLVLGIVLVVLFIPLWVTSFDSIHKRMGNRKWKKLQKWAYGLYVLMFIHAMGIQVGGLLNPRVGHVQSLGFTDMNVSRYIHIISLLLIFGSYLYLRLQKAKRTTKVDNINRA